MRALPHTITLESRVSTYALMVRRDAESLAESLTLPRTWTLVQGQTENINRGSEAKAFLLWMTETSDKEA